MARALFDGLALESLVFSELLSFACANCSLIMQNLPTTGSKLSEMPSEVMKTISPVKRINDFLD